MKNQIKFDDGSFQVEYAPGQWGQFACTAHTQWSYPDQGRNAALRAASPKPEDIVKAVNEHDALAEIAKSHETLLLALNEADRKWLPSTSSSSTFIRKAIAAGEQAARNLSAARRKGAAK